MLHKGNYVRFHSFLSGIPWIDLLNDCDAIESWQVFKSKVQEGMDNLYSNNLQVVLPRNHYGCNIELKNKKYF